jgi:hypothetical protein
VDTENEWGWILLSSSVLPVLIVVMQVAPQSTAFSLSMMHFYFNEKWVLLFSGILRELVRSPFSECI